MVCPFGISDTDNSNSILFVIIHKSAATGCLQLYKKTYFSELRLLFNLQRSEKQTPFHLHSQQADNESLFKRNFFINCMI